MELAQGMRIIKAGKRQPLLLSKKDVAAAAAASQSPRKSSNHGSLLILRKMTYAKKGRQSIPQEK